MGIQLFTVLSIVPVSLHALFDAATIASMRPRIWLGETVASALLFGVAACGGGVSADPSASETTGGTVYASPGTGGDVSAGAAVPGLAPAGNCQEGAQACVPALIDSGLSSPGTFQVQDDYVYWRVSSARGVGTNRYPNSVERVPVGGGLPELVTTLTAGRLLTIAVDATHVYLADGDHGLARVPVAGGDPEYLVETPAYAVALDETHAYFSLADPVSGVARVAKSGGESEVLFEGQAASFIALDDTYVYWMARLDSLFFLSRAPKSGGPVQAVSNTIPAEPQRMVIANGYVYLAIARPLPTTDPRGAIIRISTTDGRLTELASHPVVTGGLALDADSLYFTTCPGEPGEATVERLPHGGGSPVPIAKGGSCFAGIAADATRVFFADWVGADFESTGDCTVHVAEKCGCL